MPKTVITFTTGSTGIKCVYVWPHFVKHSEKKHEMYCCFSGAVKRNPSFTATEKDVAVAVRKWLVNSRDREGYRTQRQRVANAGDQTAV